MKNSVFDHFHILCQNGLGISFYSEMYNSSLGWYNVSILKCAAVDDCLDYLNTYSNYISYPTLSLNYEVWRIKTGIEGNICVLHA